MVAHPLVAQTTTCPTLSWLSEKCGFGSRWSYIHPLPTSTLCLSASLSRHVLFFSFIALAWQSAHSKKGGVGGRWWEGLREGGGGVIGEKGGERICGLCSSWLKQSLYYVKAVGAGSGWEEGGGEWCGVPVTDAQHKANPDRLISAILSSALWLIKGGGSAERLQELLVFFLFVFFSPQMEATIALRSCVTN